MEEPNTMGYYADTEEPNLLADLIERYKSYKLQIAILEKGMEEFKAQMWKPLEAAGGKVETPSGKASIVPAYKRVSFDTDKLKVMMELPEYGWLKQYAKESEVKASLRIT